MSTRQQLCLQPASTRAESALTFKLPEKKLLPPEALVWHYQRDYFQTWTKWQRTSPKCLTSKYSSPEQIIILYESSLNQLIDPQSTNILKGISQGSLKKWLFPDLRQEPAQDEHRTPCARKARKPSKANGLCLKGHRGGTPTGPRWGSLDIKMWTWWLQWIITH